jgi:CspA family cold shock protein
MEIHWTHLDEIPERQRLACEERLRALAEERSELIQVRIVGRQSRHHRHGEREVTIASKIRGREIVATRQRPDLGEALDLALDVFEREVHRLHERSTDRRGERPPTPPHLGIVDQVRRQEGFGFVLTDAGLRVYFHRNAVQDGLRFEALQEGQRVALNVEEGREGPQATSVTPPPADSSGP